jgi:hypothetical protein
MTCRLLFLAIVFSSCNTQIGFDSTKWKEPYDIVPHPDRGKMVQDLLWRRLLIGLDTSGVIRLLGVPEFSEPNSYTYSVKIDYGTDIDPVETSVLQLLFAGGRVDTAFVRSWRKGQ